MSETYYPTFDAWWESLHPWERDGQRGIAERAWNAACLLSAEKISYQKQRADANWRALCACRSEEE